MNTDLIHPISPVHGIKNIKDKLYNIDGNSLYNEQTGNTENELETMSFQDVLKKLEVEK